MALLLNDEQTMLRDSAREFLAERSPVSALRALRDGGSGTGHDPALWREMGELGWAGVLVPDAMGGSEFGHVGAGLILEEIGRHLVASPFLSTSMAAASVLAKAPAGATPQEALSTLALGKLVIALAQDEGDRHAPAETRTTLKESGGTLRLSGEKRHVLNGMAAERFLVSARDPAGRRTLALVRSDAEGLSRTGHVTLDAHVNATVSLDEVEVPDDAVLGRDARGETLSELALDCVYAGLAAELLGISRAAFERTLDYLREREQFGVPIGSFQALQHRAARMYCEIEVCASAVLAALQALQENKPERSLLASLAKAKSAQVARLITGEAIQMHGGIGMTDDVDIGLFFKRARAASTAFGDAAFHLDRFARLRGF